MKSRRASVHVGIWRRASISKPKACRMLAAVDSTLLFKLADPTKGSEVSDSDSFAAGGGDPVEVSFKGWDPIPMGAAQRQLVQSPHFCDQLCQLTLQGSVCIAWKPNAQRSAHSVMRYGLAIEMPCARGLGNDPLWQQIV
jgi:hypothetical protein